MWSGWATAAEAEQIAAKLLAAGDVDRPREPSLSAPETLETVTDLCETWVAWLDTQLKIGDLTRHGVRAYTNSTRRLVGSIGAVRLDALSKATFDSYRLARLDTYATSTVRQDLKALQRAWHWAEEEGHLPPNSKLPKLRFGKRDVATVRNHRTPSLPEIVTVIGQLAGWPRLATLLLFATGARIGEIAVLTWEDVDLTVATVRLKGKTGERTVPLSEPLVAELVGWGERDRSTYILGVTPKMVTGHLGTLYLKPACVAANIQPFTPHGLRRAAVDALLRAGVDVGTAAAFMGHTPEVMLAHYRTATLDDQRAALNRTKLGLLPQAEDQALKCGVSGVSSK